MRCWYSTSSWCPVCLHDLFCIRWHSDAYRSLHSVDFEYHRQVIVLGTCRHLQYPELFLCSPQHACDSFWDICCDESIVHMDYYVY